MPTSSSADSGLSRSDQIAIGIGLGIGLPTLYLTYRMYRHMTKKET
jgi:hypothetical protein